MKSIQTKIVILLLCVVLLSSCLIGVVSSRVVFGVLTEKATEQMLLLCQSNINRFDGIFESMEKVAGIMAYTVREEELNITVREGSASFAVAIFDVNKLKLTNDVLGHMAGDNLLRKVAGHLGGYFGRNDVFRIGGDEFAVVYEGGDFEDFRLRCAQCSHTMGELTLREYPQVGISCSFGVSRYTEGKDTDFASVMARADRKCTRTRHLPATACPMMNGARV